MRPTHVVREIIFWPTVNGLGTSLTQEIVHRSVTRRAEGVQTSNMSLQAYDKGPSGSVQCVLFINKRAFVVFLFAVTGLLLDQRPKITQDGSPIAIGHSLRNMDPSELDQLLSVSKRDTLLVTSGCFFDVVHCKYKIYLGQTNNATYNLKKMGYKNISRQVSRFCVFFYSLREEKIPI